MSDITISVHEENEQLLTSVSEVEAGPGDRLIVLSTATQPVQVKFLRESPTGPDEILAEHGPFEAGVSLPPFEIPGREGSVANFVHVVSGERWPKIMIKPPVRTGGG